MCEPEPSQAGEARQQEEEQGRLVLVIGGSIGLTAVKNDDTGGCSVCRPRCWAGGEVAGAGAGLAGLDRGGLVGQGEGRLAGAAPGQLT